MEEISQLTPHQLQTLLLERPDTILLDVREDEEVAFNHIPGYTHIPMNLIPLRQNELPDDRPIVLYCHHGIRSQHAAMYLANAGFDQLYNLKGGIDAWCIEVDPTVPRY
ncbi:MAG: rhodanese-like domain-containing protein [Neisseria sp.]|uniref:rhodanese-like domain-containing protein n=1 Tax=Neisseria sp. TaxID=192066 RepID=UPI0026DB45F7|nr:rhodanese-like domain-containing protein [Neisseria sp.]MDO4248887.1 rhodanese-like domain-containing protein [Neisseria sp.]